MPAGLGLATRRVPDVDMNIYWVEDKDGNIEPSDIIGAAAWKAFNSGRVAADAAGDVVISTVFLGIAHGNAGTEEDPKPILYESLVTDTGGEVEQQRYITRARALEGHKALVEKYLPKPTKPITRLSLIWNTD